MSNMRNGLEKLMQCLPQLLVLIWKVLLEGAVVQAELISAHSGSLLPQLRADLGYVEKFPRLRRPNRPTPAGKILPKKEANPSLTTMIRSWSRGPPKSETPLWLWRAQASAVT